MLQRAFDPSDPASGKWEFPGGCCEEGEDVLTTAVREWCEETGCVPPIDGVLYSQWTSRSGVYQGVIIDVPSESSIDINPAEKFISNPDDPDGDLVETCAWWDPALLQDNPAIRAELSADADLVLFMLEPDVASTDEVLKSAWAAHPMHKVEKPLADFHAPRIQDGLQAMITKDQIKAAVRGYLDANS
jgi:8-oxo-dGTP pyrophosphatase MutT (NUDIX family)